MLLPSPPTALLLVRPNSLAPVTEPVLRSPSTSKASREPLAHTPTMFTTSPSPPTETAMVLWLTWTPTSVDKSTLVTPSTPPLVRSVIWQESTARSPTPTVQRWKSTSSMSTTTFPPSAESAHSSATALLSSTTVPVVALPVPISPLLVSRALLGHRLPVVLSRRPPGLRLSPFLGSLDSRLLWLLYLLCRCYFPSFSSIGQTRR